MHAKGILKIVGYVLMFIGAAMLACAGVSVWYGESVMPLSLGALISVAVGWGMFVYAGNANTDVLTVKDGCSVVTLSWVLACLFGAIPFYAMGWIHPTQITITKSIYEAVSGFTTTGSSIFTDVEVLPKGILFWRSLTHWFGGMGMVVFAIAILSKLGAGGMQAFRMESPGPLKADKLVPRIHDTAKILYTVYFFVTVVEVFLLLAVGVGLFDALIHTFGTVGTGGFSNYNLSVAGLQNPAAEYIIAFFMWLSGANFALIFLFAWKGERKTALADPEFRVYTAITAITTALIVFFLWIVRFESWSIEKIFRVAFFQVATIFTTTGFATSDFSVWPLGALMVILILMFIGASTGSTAGGLKVLRHMINFKLMKHEILKIVKPNLVTTVKIGDRPIESSVVSSVAALSLMYLATFGVVTFIVGIFEKDLVVAATASIANLGNIGPGVGAVGPIGNYASIHPVGLWALIVAMFIGRLELYTVFVLIASFAWRRQSG